jgi:hypothetical protein
MQLFPEVFRQLQIEEHMLGVILSPFENISKVMLASMLFFEFDGIEPK